MSGTGDGTGWFCSQVINKHNLGNRIYTYKSITQVMFITQVIIYNLATEQTIDSFRYIISEL